MATEPDIPFEGNVSSEVRSIQLSVLKYCLFFVSGENSLM